MSAETRIIPLTDEFMKDKKIYANIWAYLQTISYLSKDKQRFVYKAHFTLKEMHETIAIKEKGKIIPSLSTVKNVWGLYKQLGFITEGQIEDLSGNNVEVYILSQDFSIFQPIPLQTLSFLVNVANSNVIKVYAYLLNKYKWKQKENKWYSFTIKELLSAIGYSYKNDNVKMMTDILEMLKAIKLIDYEITYYKQVGKPPIPMHTLTIARDYKPKEEVKKAEMPSQHFVAIDYGFEF